MPRAHIAAWQDASHADSAIAPSPEHTAALKPRQMKISYVPTTREPVPFLRLRGKWLAQAGFAIGSDVRISIAPQRLVIDIKSPEGKTKKQIRDERRAALRDNNTTVGTDVYPSLGDVEMIRDRACVRAPASTLLTFGVPGSRRRKIPRVNECAGTWPERIRSALQPTSGDVLYKVRSRLNAHPATIASRAQMSEASYRAFDRGERQPNLATFIAIAWTLNQDPRELFDKVLLQMGFPPGTRPVISASPRQL
jgi:hypothetical protein